MKRAAHSTPRCRSGFSLLELLAVMSIMAMLTTLAVTSYFGAIRGMTRRSAVKHFADTLILARQRACMEGARMSVVVFNEDTGAEDGLAVAPSYVICKEIGRLTYVQGSTKLADEFTELDRMFGVKPSTDQVNSSYLGSLKLYNLTPGKGGWSHVYPWVMPYPLSYDSAYKPAAAQFEINAFAFEINQEAEKGSQNKASWDVGHVYGVEASQIGSLPRNFEFSELRNQVSKTIVITFKPDGTADQSKTVKIRETQNPKLSSDVEVEAGSGKITYLNKWN